MADAIEYARPRTATVDGPFLCERADRVARPTFEATADRVRVRAERWPVLRHIVRETIAAAVACGLFVGFMTWAAMPFDAYDGLLKLAAWLLGLCIVVNAATRAARPPRPDWLVLTRGDARVSLPRQQQAFSMSQVVAVSYVEQVEAELRLTRAAEDGGREIVGVVRGNARRIRQIAGAIAEVFDVPLTEQFVEWDGVVRSREVPNDERRQR